MVTYLMDTKNRNWDVDILNDLFELEDIDHILSIPISYHPTEDKLIWQGEGNYAYSVKSCYRLLMEEKDNIYIHTNMDKNVEAKYSTKD